MTFWRDQQHSGSAPALRGTHTVLWHTTDLSGKHEAKLVVSAMSWAQDNYANPLCRIRLTSQGTPWIQTTLGKNLVHVCLPSVHQMCKIYTCEQRKKHGR